MNRRNADLEYSNGFSRDVLLQDFLGLASISFEENVNQFQPILDWTKGLMIGSRMFQVEGHEYELAMLQEEAPRQCFKKGAQMGITETQILKTMHGLIFSRYPQGVLYLFPTVNDVTDFSKGRFGPLLADNPEIENQVSNTDAVGVKRIRRSMLYLRGARSTGKIEGMKRTSSQLKSVPVDRVVFDEVDEMDPYMVDLALERLSHSMVKEEAYLSTPSIPSWGIDKLYNSSDQRIWMVKCQGCGTETCLELEFPNCLLELSDGRVIRACKKCKKEIFPAYGRWVAQYPDRSKDLVGWWISQLNSIFVNPGKILKDFNDPPHGNIQEVYNSKLAMAYVPAENRLTSNDIYASCGQDVMFMHDRGPCAMGVDVGKVLTVVVGFKPRGSVLQICYLARVSDFRDLHDIMKRFNVRCCVMDLEPETRKARDFQKTERAGRVFLCDYVASPGGGFKWDEENGLVKVNRTELCDAIHDLFARGGRIVLPRRGEEIEIYAREMANIAKVLQEDPETGSREYRYRKLGEDHYFHATNYFYLAAQKIPLSESYLGRYPMPSRGRTDYDIFAPNYGAKRHELEGETMETWNPFSGD